MLSATERIRDAVELTARCRSVEYTHAAPENERWTAVVWAGSDYVAGHGPDAWTAVQAAHALRAMEVSRRGYE